MTPAEDYAQKREEAVELIRQHAPTHLQNALIELLRPAIALQATRANDSQIPLGASKFGGAPDVPPNFEWPLWNDKPLGFLAQINLEEVARFDVENLLPKSGLLLFFLWLDDDEGEPILGEAGQRESWRVSYSSAAVLRRQAPPPESANRDEVKVVRVLPEGRWTLPNRDERFPVADEFAQEMNENWQQMLGYARALQISPDVHARANFEHWRTLQGAKTDASRWELLLQLDTFHLFEEADDSVFYFMIRQSDLAANDFSNVWLDPQCT